MKPSLRQVKARLMRGVFGLLVAWQWRLYRWQGWVEARIVAADQAGSTLASGDIPEDMAGGQPPAHWAAVVRRHAPWLLRRPPLSPSKTPLSPEAGLRIRDISPRPEADIDPVGLVSEGAAGARQESARHESVPGPSQRSKRDREASLTRGAQAPARAGRDEPRGAARFVSVARQVVTPAARPDAPSAPRPGESMLVQDMMPGGHDRAPAVDAVPPSPVRRAMPRSPVATIATAAQVTSGHGDDGPTANVRAYRDGRPSVGGSETAGFEGSESQPRASSPRRHTTTPSLEGPSSPGHAMTGTYPWREPASVVMPEAARVQVDDTADHAPRPDMQTVDTVHADPVWPSLPDEPEFPSTGPHDWPALPDTSFVGAAGAVGTSARIRDHRRRLQREQEGQGWNG